MSTCFLNAANRDGFYESSPIVVSLSSNDALTVLIRSGCKFIVLSGTKSFKSRTTRTLCLYILKFVPHDTAKLIELQGGVENFIPRLDFIFDDVWDVILSKGLPC